MGDTLNQLGIYWPKLLAQTINFGIVLFVLWKFAYKPVLTMLAQRREKIAQSIANADKIKAELAATEASRREILDKANAASNKLIEEARAAAARVQEVETQKAIAAANQIIAKAKEASEVELARMKTELRKELVRLVAETTAKVSGKVLTLDDQKRLADETTNQLAA